MDSARDWRKNKQRLQALWEQQREVSPLQERQSKGIIAWKLHNFSAFEITCKNEGSEPGTEIFLGAEGEDIELREILVNKNLSRHWASPLKGLSLQMSPGSVTTPAQLLRCALLQQLTKNRIRATRHQFRKLFHLRFIISKSMAIGILEKTTSASGTLFNLVITCLTHLENLVPSSPQAQEDS